MPGPSPDPATAWSRRYKANLERLASGDRDQIADVVNGLSARERDHGLSAGDQRMLRRARQLLAHPDSS
jgi:CarD family transcriptional regulator